MTLEELQQQFETHKANELEWIGNCHDCGVETIVLAVRDEEDISLAGGAVYNPLINGEREFFIKCDECFDKNQILKDYMPVETYSRIVGYLRPISQWNKGKVEEFKMRRDFRV